MTENSVPAASAQILDWMREGEARFVAALAGLTEEELGAESALPDWSRAHVAAHLARNAEAVSRLLSWARTGDESLMYPDLETRNRDIEHSARQAPADLRDDVRDTSARFDADIDELPAQAWNARVRTFQGREVPASFALWARTREVWLHVVDLGAGVSVESWPGELVDALLDEVVATVSGRAEAPSWLLLATDRERNWRIGAEWADQPGQPGQAMREEGAEVGEVSGRAADLLAWLTGRSTGQGLATDGVLPSPPPWM